MTLCLAGQSVYQNTLFIRTLWRHTMTIKESANLLFEITHPEQAFSFAALKEYLENMYFG